jgi:phospholipid/cholesterol/gamma-HCH transport system substrate-binding protein
LKISSDLKVGFFAAITLAFFIFFILYFNLAKVRLGKFNTYTITFRDLTGLTSQDDVKMAGFKVGFIQSVFLKNGGTNVDVNVCLNSDILLRQNAQAEIRQDGLLGAKYLDINPGDSSLPILKSGEKLSNQGRSSASVEDIIHRFRNVAENIEELTKNLKNNFGQEQQVLINETFKNIYSSSIKIAEFSDCLAKNQDNLNKIIADAKTLTEGLAPLAEDLKKVSFKLDDQVLPAFQASMEKISNVFDRDFGSVADRLNIIIGNINNIALKINDGHGLFGQFVNDKQMYNDLAFSINKIKEFLDTKDKKKMFKISLW